MSSHKDELFILARLCPGSIIRICWIHNCRNWNQRSGSVICAGWIHFPYQWLVVISSLHWHLHKCPHSQEDSRYISHFIPTKSILWIGQLSFSVQSGRKLDGVVSAPFYSSYWDPLYMLSTLIVSTHWPTPGGGWESHAVLSKQEIHLFSALRFPHLLVAMSLIWEGRGKRQSTFSETINSL